jgi:uncharacterized BrkB/YihY/UPF0761 family membrane protein
MRARTKIYNRVAGESKNRKLRNVFLGLLLLSFIFTISLWMIIGMMDEINLLQGSPWDETRSGEMLHLLTLFLISFSSSTLYIFYYRGVREISKTAPRYLLAIAVIVLLAKVIFGF